jgi:hypothetical protein
MSPLCQKHVKPENANDMEKFYPLHAFVCEKCWLMQLEEFATPYEIFADEYAYFSSYSQSWLDHARKYAEAMTKRFGLKVMMDISCNGLNKRGFLFWGSTLLQMLPKQPRKKE